MADVFVSYKREEVAVAELISRMITEEGYSVFHDIGVQGIKAGETWDKRLEAELEQARCCVVLWSRASVESDNVRSEARRAHARGILVPAKIGACSPPIGLDGVQAADLIGWTGDRAYAQWRFLVDRGIALKVGRRSEQTSAAEPTKKPTYTEASKLDRRAVFASGAAAVAAASIGAVAYFTRSDRPNDGPAPQSSDLPAPVRRSAADYWSTSSTIEARSVLTRHGGFVSSARFSNDQSRIASVSMEAVNLWDVQGDRFIATLAGHSRAVYDAVFSPDSTRLVTSCADGAARIWRADNGALLLTLRGHSDWVRTSQFSPDGGLVITASKDGTAKLWSAASGSLIRTISPSRGELMSAEFSSDGARIVIAGEHGFAGVYPTDGTHAQPHELVGHEDIVSAAVFSPSGRLVATSGWDAAAKIWSADNGQLIRDLRGHTGIVGKVLFFPDGQRAATVGDALKIWSVQSGRLLLDIGGHGNSVWDVNVSSDGNRLVTAGADNTAKVWDARTGAIIASLSGHSDWVRTAEFSPDGSLILTAGQDRTVRVWQGVA